MGDRSWKMSKLNSLVYQIASLILLPTTVLVAGFNNHAQAEFVSESGNLRIQRLRSYQEACATKKQSDYYFDKSGISGFLYPNKCGSRYGTDVFVEYRFVDISGTERCTGIVVFDPVGRGLLIEMTWQIQGVVPGYSCNTIGEIYRTRMSSGRTNR